MTLQNRMRQAKRIYAIDPKSQDPRVLEMKKRIADARKEAEAKKAADKAKRTGAR